MDSTTASWSYSSFWGSFWGQFWVEIIGGTISALLFLFIVLLLFKPKIKIAPFLCEITPAGSPQYYSFKIVNHSFFSAHELKFELHQMTRIPMGNGQFNNKFEKLSLKNDELSHVPRRPFYWQKHPANLHCILVRSYDDINSILSNQYNAILIKVSLKHGLTGLSNVYEQEYANLSDIKKTQFKPGTKFGTI